MQPERPKLSAENIEGETVIVTLDGLGSLNITTTLNADEEWGVAIYRDLPDEVDVETYG